MTREALLAELDAQAATARYLGHLGAEEVMREAIAALRETPADPPTLVEAQDDTWSGAVAYVRDMAQTIRNLTARFVANTAMGEMATIRAEALEECANGMERAAAKARKAQQAAPSPAAPAPEGPQRCIGADVRPCVLPMDHVGACQFGAAAPAVPSPEMPVIQAGDQLIDLKGGLYDTPVQIAAIKRAGVVLWERRP